jgi:NTP pyrophosphatase (non-canonical NTP hydrolase)
MSILKDYQSFTPTTFIVPDNYVSAIDSYLFSGLASEAGEVAGNYAKYCRGDFEVDELKKRTTKELGDVMYFVSQIANSFHLDLEDVLINNQVKLQDRLDRNKIKGDGETR